MARGSYLGKISAIVSINTSSVRPSLDQSSKDINAWAKSTQSRISGAANSAGRALEGIFTPLQRLQAAIKNANRNPLDLKIQNPGAYLQLAKATEQIAKPLGQVQSQFASLANSVQAELLPVLQSAQKQTTSLFNSISNGAKVSDRDLENTAARVKRLTDAIARANEASQLARGGRTGRELAFVAPRVQDELSRSAQLSQRAADAPVGVRSDPSFRQRIQELDQLRQRIVQYQASVDRRQVLGLDTREARARLDDTIRRSKDLRSSLERSIDLDIRAGVAKAEIDRLRGAIRDIREGVTFTVTGRVQNFEQARQEVSRLQAQVGELSSGRGAFSGRLQQLSELVATGDITELEQVRRLIDDIGESLSERQRLDIYAEAATRAARELDRTLRSLRENATFVITARPQNLEQVQSELQRILGQFDQLTEAQRGLLDGRVTAVIEAVGRQDLDAAIEALQQLRRDAGTAITVTVDTAAAEDRIRRINDAWDFAVRGVPSSIAQIDGEFQALAGRIGRLNITDRLDLDPLIRDFRDSVQAGDSLFAQFQRLLAIRERLESIESVASPAGGGLGAALGDPSRQIDQLRSGIVGVKGQLDSLPASIRTSFIPAINAAEAEFARLSARGPAATAEQIENARIEVERLSSSASRAASVISSLGGAGVGGIIAGLDGRVVQGFTAQLQVLQGVIAGVSGAARNDLAAAFDGVRQSIVSAMTDGTIATRDTQESIDASIQSLARLAATASNQNIGRVLTQIARAGDIGRRGLDRFALAAQQAGFAIDDFFSVTGGFDQRIRAVSNNITQLAFIIGSTKGLFIGLSVVIGAQLVLAISKWINSGRTAEDNSKALNDTLARQKNLVEALAESFRALGDSLAQGTLSNQASDARDFAESLNRARKARKDLNDEAVLQNDPVVRRERANQARIERELQSADNQGTVVQLQAQLEESRRREQNRRGVLVQPAPGDRAVEDALRRRSPNPFRQNVPNLPDGNDIGSLRERRAALGGPLRRLRQIISEGPSFFDGGARFDIASRSFDELNSLATRLDSAISGAVDAIADDLAGAARGPAATIRNSQQEVADAIEAGVPGARRLGVFVDQIGNEFQDAIRALEAAVAITDPAERERAISEARSRLDKVRGRRPEIEARTDAVRRERTFNPEFQFESVLARAQSGIDRIGAPAQGFQRQLRELQFQRDSVRAQLEAAPADPILGRAEQELTRALISLEQAISDLEFEARESSRLRGDSEQGRRLSMTDAQRAAEEMQQGLNSIAKRFGEVAENTTGLVDNAGMQEAQARFMEDQSRQIAPAGYALQDAVQNAILQGPSRAALNAADVTTMEGSRELNRLLRGDDPARDVNLLELQKQTQLLEDSLEEQRKLAERFGGVVA